MNWDDLVAELIIELGWTKDEVLDQMTMPLLEALRRQWENWPPVRVAVGAFMGHKPPNRNTNTSRDYAELLGMFPGGNIKSRQGTALQRG